MKHCKHVQYKYPSLISFEIKCKCYILDECLNSFGKN